MPLFFMLSGFSLTAMYGRTEWALTSCGPSRAPSSGANESAVEEGRASSDDNTTALLTPPAFAWRKFYRNRAARVLPVFYVCMLIAVPLFVWNLDAIRYSARALSLSLLATASFCATWLSFLGLDVTFKVINQPGWFVCTLMWFWVAFPWWLPRAQRLTDRQLTARIAWCFYLQLVFMFGWYLLFQDAFGGGTPAFNTAGKNPISRFPLFLMGMYAGLLALRHPPAPPTAAGAPTAVVVPAAEAQDTMAAAATAKDEMPWPSCFLGLPIPPLPCLARLSGALAAPTTQSGWARKASWESAAILVLSIAIGVGETLFALHSPTHAGFQAQLWWQAVVPMVQLNIIVALTRDGGSSLASKTLLTPLSQYLGKLSMTLYLIHMPLMTYVSIMFHPGTVPVLMHCQNLDSLGEEQRAACLSAMNDAHIYPLWYTVIVVALAIVLSEILYRLVEVPARKALRAK